MIYNCGSDGRVASDIRERYAGLVKADYAAIIGVRDVHPIPALEEGKLRSGLKMYIPSEPIQVTIVLGVREIECWFLAEHTHFPRIHARLTVAAIKSAFGFDVASDDMQVRQKPSTDLHQIYRLAGLEYNKSRVVLQATVAALGYDQLYLEVTKRVPDLATLAQAIDKFLSQEDR